MDVNVWVALGAGLMSFVSPCILPLYPSYLSYITGISVSELKDSGAMSRQARLKTMLHSLFFLLGFSLLFYSLGYGANAFSDFFRDYQHQIRQFSAILIIVMGLFLMGIFQPQLLMKSKKLDFRMKKSGYLASFVFGVGFSAGWTPCTGPILAAIIAMAASSPGAWFEMTSAYALGFAIPFMALSFFVGSARWLLKYSNTFMKVGGALMLIMGILLFTDQMSQITIWLNQLAPAWLG